MKVCPQCNIEKENEDFPKRKKSKDGLYSWCKECCRKKTKEHRLRNPEIVQASRDKRRDRALEVAREYKRKNKDRLDKLKKAHYYLNREKITEKARWYSKNLTEEQRKKRKEYHLNWSKTENSKKYQRATKSIYKAIKSGLMIRPTKCTLCFKEEKIQAHHPDYDKPLEVVWLCSRCHGKVHRK